MKPVARLTSDWKTTWKRRMPARRYPTPFSPPPLCSEK